MTTLKDLTGKKFGKLTVLSITDIRKNKSVMWKCVCDCGNECLAKGSEMIRGKKRSCGCLGGIKTHGLKHHPLYGTWSGMIRRCYNDKDKDYPRYGGRGIKVEWTSIQEFVNDMYDSYIKHKEKYGKDTTLDRIDNNGNYSKENCRWTTMKEQCKNRHNTISYEKEGIIYKSLGEICKISNISEGTLRCRLKRGMSIKEGLSTPLKYMGKKGHPEIDIIKS